jgi:hypothetical protein
MFDGAAASFPFSGFLLARKIEPIPSFLPLFQLLAFLRLALTK